MIKFITALNVNVQLLYESEEFGYRLTMKNIFHDSLLLHFYGFDGVRCLKILSLKGNRKTEKISINNALTVKRIFSLDKQDLIKNNLFFIDV